MNIYSQPQCSCIICKEVKSVKGIHTHFERAHGTPKQQSKYSNGNNGCYHLEEYKDKLRKPTHEVTQICDCCKIKFTYTKLVDHPERTTCSHSCSASLGNKKREENGYVQSAAVIWTDEMRENHADLTRQMWEDPEYVKQQMTRNRRFTSKNEVFIRDYFISHFPEDDWTFGGSLKVNDENIVRDLYSNKLKICFEYDGIWHFKDIYGQLTKKQKKDKLLEQWCLENEFSLVRIDEDKFSKNSLKFLEETFYSIKEPTIIKIGDRY